MAVEFKTENQKKVYEKVAGILKEEFGKQFTQHDSAPNFGLRNGSAFIQVSVWPISDTSTLVRTFAWVVMGAETTAELTKFLLEESYNMRFGAFAMEPGTGDIIFTHAIVGEGCDADELMYSIRAVSQTADEYDDKIVQKFGGQRAVDRMG